MANKANPMDDHARALLAACTALIDESYRDESDPMSEDRRDHLREMAANTRIAMDAYRELLARVRAASEPCTEEMTMKDAGKRFITATLDMARDWLAVNHPDAEGARYQSMLCDACKEIEQSEEAEAARCEGYDRASERT